VHAAADELFSGVLPGLDGAQVRQLGAHLREAAAPELRAGEDHGDFARRGLRISRSLAGCGEITGRLHAEAAEQVIATFEELGAKTGPDDTRTKPQRWADALTRLCAATNVTRGASSGRAEPEPTEPETTESQGAGLGSGGPGAAGQSQAAHRDDDQPWLTGAGGITGHDLRGSGQSGDPHAADGPPVCPSSDHPAHGDGNGRGHGGPVPASYQRPRLIVTVPLATLLGQPLSPGATVLGPGTPLTGEAARRLACDAQVIRLVTGPGRGSPYPGASPPSGIQQSGGSLPSGGTPGGRDRRGTPLGNAPPGESTCPGGGPTPSGNGPPGATQPGGLLPVQNLPGVETATGNLTERLAVGVAQLPPPLAGPPTVLDLGRASPGWTARQRDALAAQHGGRCAYPGCNGPIDVLHHVRPWASGGPTSISNGLPLCLFHHWLVHEGGWQVSKHPDATVTVIPPPPGWRPGTIYRHGKPLPEH
jgi:hypothetical protein